MNLYKKYNLLTLVCLTMLLFCNMVTAQSKEVEISATVVDEQGNPLEQVAVYGPNGVLSSTNKDGLFKITLPKEATMVIEKEGYKSQSLTLSSITNTGDKVTLVKSELLAGENDIIKLGVATSDRRSFVGSVSAINTKDRMVYDNTQRVRDYITGLTVGVTGGGNIRGIGNALFVIDGVFGRNPDIMNMEEVEQITVLKDANAVALYGSQGENGVIIINTKRGKLNKKTVNVNVRSGIRSAISFPKYLDAATSMEIIDELAINSGVDPSSTNLFRNRAGADDSLNAIQSTRNGLNPIEFPDVNLYDFTQDFTETTNVVSEFSGGNDKSQYYINLGWVYNNSWVNLNEDINEGSNRFNVRGNIDFKVNDWISSSIDGVAIISSSKSARANLLDAATTFIPFNYSPLLPVSDLDLQNNPDLQTIFQGATVYNGNLLGSPNELNAATPVATAIAGGYQDRVFRQTQFNNSINFDLSAITEGLSAKTFLSFDFLDTYTTSINHQFRVYSPEWEDNKISSFSEGNGNVFGIDLRDLRESTVSNGFITRIGAYALVNYENTFGNHSINTTALAYYNSDKRDGRLQTDKDAHLGFQATYGYKNKLYVDFSGAYVHSLKLAEGNRGALSPTVGLGYILSEESFLKDVSFINYLKLKVSGGIIKTDRTINGYYLYDENYTTGGSFGWADGIFSNQRQNITQGANPDLGYVERVDLNLGLETYLMNSLWLEANLFRTERNNLITRLVDQYPSYYGPFRPQDNFNANLYEGFELGLNYNKTYKDFSIGFGANMLYVQTERSKISEINPEEYLNRQGLELSTIFGLQDAGFFTNEDFTPDPDGNLVLNSGIDQFGFDVQPGDIKYVDQNNDNIINQDDQIALGQSNSPFSYGVNLNIKYKAFNLFVLGTGQTSGLGNKLTGFNDYFSPNGTQKFSEVVLDRWTPETADTATFPRLTQGNNPNNFRTSSFWLYDNSFFRINRAQLTFEFDDAFCDKLGIKAFSLNVQGTNLFEFSENADIRQLNVGGNPQFRNYTFGIRVSF